jgi:hypothetical protein
VHICEDFIDLLGTQILVLVVSIRLSVSFQSTNVVDFEQGMTYFCRISIFAIKNTKKYLVFDSSCIPVFRMS